MTDTDQTFSQALTAVLDTETAYQWLPEGTWMEGGCALLALALHQCFGGTLVTIGRPTPLGVVDHVVLELTTTGQTLYLDYDGLQTRDEMTAKVAFEWRMASVSWGCFDPHALNTAGVEWDEGNVEQLATFLTVSLASTHALANVLSA